MKRRNVKRWMSAFLCGAMCISLLPATAMAADTTPASDALSVEDAAVTNLTVTVDGEEVKVTQYEDVYVTNPTSIAKSGANYNGKDQGISIYVPEGATEESPVLFLVNNSGWQSDAYSSRTKINNGATYDSSGNQVGAALARNFVVVSYGCRSRNDAADANGDYLGHSPATMTDTKAALRYLRYNEAALGCYDSDMIFMNGTSGGGALTTVIAASGNSSDYYESLYEIGAAGISKNADGTYTSTIDDDILAAVAYCPINDLGMASAGYEFTYYDTRVAMAEALGDGINTAFQNALTESFTIEDALASSKEQVAEYAEYVDSLGLKRDDGTALTSANLKDAMIELLDREITESVTEVGIEQMTKDSTGVCASANGQKYTSESEGWKPWLTFQADGSYTFNYDNYVYWLAMNKKLKLPSAFSNAGLGIASQNEDSLYGTKEYQYSAFSEYAWNNDKVKDNGCGKDDTGLAWDEYIKTDAGKALVKQIKMSSPIQYLIDAEGESDSAPYWYVRHGMADRDTSFAVQTVLYHAMKNDASIEDVNFEFAWIKSHSGNYDVPEAYAWIDEVVATERDKNTDKLSAEDAVKTEVEVTVDGKPMKVTKYEDVYVTNPTNVANAGKNYNGSDQGISVYVPEGATADSPILFLVNNSGWQSDSYGDRTQIPSAKTDRATGAVIINDKYDSSADQVGAALARNFVVVSYGCRSRNDKADANGNYLGHSPATMTDTKAAIRYLRYNEELFGCYDTDYIFVNGTSGGGALTTVIAASGNSSDYYEFLYEIGAAGIEKNEDGTYTSTINDDIFAAVAYCPINDLGMASAGYEFTYYDARVAMAEALGDGVNSAFQDKLSDTFNIEKALAASKEQKGDYAEYVDSLGLKKEDGSALTSANLKDAMIALLEKEISESMYEVGVEQMKKDSTDVCATANGQNYTAASEGWKPWLTFNADGSYTFNFDNFTYWLAMNKKLKLPSAFSNAGLGIASQNEDSLYGTKEYQYSAFSEYSWNNDTVKGNGCGKDDTGLAWDEFITTPAGKDLMMQIKMSSPIQYLIDEDGESDSAPYWYVRHGVADRDTSFAVQTVLYYAMMNDASIEDVNFEFAWIKPHSGNYDVPEAFAWIDEILGEEAEKATGIETVDGLNFVIMNGELATGWALINNTWYLANENGVAQTGWKLVNGKWYYMNQKGEMQTGWLYVNGKWYFLNPSGSMATGWILVNNKWYYMSASGAMTTGWIYVNNKWYYMSASGAMQTGWVKYNNKWYYMAASGAMMTGWVKDNNTWYYLYSNGAMAANTWIGNYYVNASGAWVATK